MNMIWKTNEIHAIQEQTDKLPKIESLRKGDYFRFPGKKTVYVYQGYCRVNKKYEYTKFDDICSVGYRHKGTPVETEFEF